MLTRLLNDITPKLNTLEGHLNRIEEKIDRQIEAPFKAGLTFLRLKKFQEALNDFVRADAIDAKHGAVTKLLLSALLFKEGKTQQAIEIFKDAFYINPLAVLSSPPAKEALSRMLPRAKEKVSSTIWTVRLAENKEIPDPKHDQKPFLWIWPKPYGAVRTISALGADFQSPSYLVVLWQEVDFHADDYDIEKFDSFTNVILPNQRFIAALDIASGNCLWCNIADDKELVLTTPRYVVLKSIRIPTYELWNVQTGNVSAIMSHHYYEAMFCPNQEQIHQLDLFRQSQCNMSVRVTQKLKQRLEPLMDKRYGRKKITQIKLPKDIVAHDDEATWTRHAIGRLLWSEFAEDYQVFLKMAELLKEQGYDTQPAPTEAEFATACKRSLARESRA